MSSKLDEILPAVEELSVEELWSLQERVLNRLRAKTTTSTNGNGQTKEAKLPDKHVVIPGAYRRSPEKIEAFLATIFTPEELARMGKTDFSKLPRPEKSITEIISEDREDRF